MGEGRWERGDGEGEAGGYRQGDFRNLPEYYTMYIVPNILLFLLVYVCVCLYHEGNTYWGRGGGGLVEGCGQGDSRYLHVPL